MNKPNNLSRVGFVSAVAMALYLSSLYSYLLFHSLIEIVTVAIAFTLFILAWNTRGYLTNNYLRLLGIGYVLIALIDLIHTLAFKGMNVFPGYDANLPTQLWIAARYLQAVTLLAAPFFIGRKVNDDAVFAGYTAVVALLVTMIYSGNFPDCFIEGRGLTAFKIRSEYLISVLLIVALYLFYRKREHFDTPVFFLVAASIGCTILSELSFTAYASVYGFANMVGHFAKLAAFYLIYRAILVTGLKEPFNLIFRDLKQTEEAQQKSHDILEEKVKERTEALCRLNRELRAISSCNQILMRAEDEQSLLDDICRIICDDAGYRMAWVGFAENDEAQTIRPVAWAGVEEGYLAQAGICWADTERGRGPSGTAIRIGESSCIQDFSTYPNAIPWRDAALQRGYRSSISMPLKNERTNTFGTLTIYSSEPYAFTPEEIRLLEELAGDLAFGITVLRARIERKQAEESLRMMNERYTLATRAGRLGVWDWDLQKNELVWDDRMYALYGVKREDFAGAYAAWLQGVHPDDRAASDEASKQAQRGEREYDTEFRVVWPDGSVHYLKADGQFVRDAQGTPVRMTGVNVEITELKKAELSINELNRDLEKRVDERTAQLKTVNKELEAFAYSVSHDLRAPLRHIDGFLDLLRARTASTLDDKSQHYMDTISDAARRMGTLIDDLLDFSRMGRKEMAAESVRLDDLLQEVIHEFDAETRGRNIDWHIDELPVVTGDRAMLHIALVNLISNALKFTQKRVQADIEIGSRHGAADEVVIFVRDNGAGFDMQYADKLFCVFQRLHTSDEFEGTGIGLANARRIIGRHGGRTWAEGKVDGGATFYFSLPHVAGKGGHA
jgi:PAS domain S-box-containing protein